MQALRQNGRDFPCQGHDGQDRRIAHGCRQDGAVCDIQVIRQGRAVKRVLFLFRQGQHAAGMTGVQGAQELVLFRDPKA